MTLDTSVSPANHGAEDRVGDVAQLYLGNILFALERCAMALDAEEKPLDAAFYRGIGRKLAEAHGRHRPDRAP
jgi:hypothetical protein